MADLPSPEKAPRRKIIVTWRTLVFGAEKFSAKRFRAMVLFYVLLSLILFSVYFPVFFPSPKISLYFSPVVFLCAAAATFQISRWLFEKGKNKSKTDSKFLTLLGVIILFVIIWALWCAVFLGAGHLYTNYYGVPSKMQISVSGKKIRTSNKHPTRYCVESDDVGTGVFQEICVQKSDYHLIHEGSVMTLYGKQSELGFVYEKYSIKDHQ